MKYGSYSFSPVPFITMNKEFQKSEDGTLLGTVFKITLDGVLTPLPSGDGGLEVIDAYQDNLRSAFDVDGKLFELNCDGTPLIYAYPRILSLQFEKSSNNWVYTCPFQIQIEFDDEPASSGENGGAMPPYISQASETWSVEFVQESQPYSIQLNETVPQQIGSYATDANPYQIKLTHQISAVGKRHYSGSTITGTLDKQAWEQARDYVLPRLGYDSERVSASGVLNLDGSLFSAYNHFRTNEVNELGGSFAVTETWLVVNTDASGNPGRALEDFTVNVRKAVENPITTVSIEGNILGLSTRSYGTNPGDFAVTETAYDAASGYWNIVQDRLLARATLMSTGLTTRSLNPAAKSSVVGHSPSKGSVNYNYEFDDRPCNFIAGSLSEVITINDTYPTDVFAQLQVMGRAAGPVLQDISTKGPATRDVSIEVIMDIPTGCASGDVSALFSSAPTSQVRDLLCGMEQQLTNAYSQVFKHKDDSSWNPKTGQYTRNVGWTYQDCSGNPTTSFC